MVWPHPFRTNRRGTTEAGPGLIPSGSKTTAGGAAAMALGDTCSLGAELRQT